MIVYPVFTYLADDATHLHLERIFPTEAQAIAWCRKTNAWNQENDGLFRAHWEKMQVEEGPISEQATPTPVARPRRKKHLAKRC